MITGLSFPTGCGVADCRCAQLRHWLTRTAGVRINGVLVPDSAWAAGDGHALSVVWCELLRQQAVGRGLLAPSDDGVAPPLSPHDHAVIESMLQADLPTPTPTQAACERHYEQHKGWFAVGQTVHLRHILFAIDAHTDVTALTHRAEEALLALSRKWVPDHHFEALAAALSDCPSAAQGGDLGWITPDDCPPELANELFIQSDWRSGMGVHPRLVRTRQGLHIVEVMGRRKGKPLRYDAVKDQIAHGLLAQAQAQALGDYLQGLWKRAHIEGLALGGVVNRPPLQ